MFDVSYRRSFIFPVITISNALSVVSRLYISYKQINFELDGNQACLLVNVLIRLGRARLGAGDHAAPRWVRLSPSAPAPCRHCWALGASVAGGPGAAPRERRTPAPKGSSPGEKAQ